MRVHAQAGPARHCWLPCSIGTLLESQYFAPIAENLVCVREDSSLCMPLLVVTVWCGDMLLLFSHWLNWAFYCRCLLVRLCA